ncbi:ATP-binding cassette domain-containing protein [Rhodococcus sp. 3Y1]
MISRCLPVNSGPVPAVRGVSLTVYPGQTVAIVGESGSGKSTTAHSIINLLPGTGKVTAGEIIFDGKDISKVSEKDFVHIREARSVWFRRTRCRI